MHFTRRALLLGAGTLVVGCASSPTVVAPSHAPARVLPEEPVQDEALARAAALVAGVREQVETAEAGDWRTAALAQCDDHLARLNSTNPFGSPDPVFSPAAATAGDRLETISAAVAELTALAKDATDDGTRLLLLSVAAATRGLANDARLPGEGGEPSPVGQLPDQLVPTLGHVWALVAGIERALGTLPDDDALREPLTTRLAAVKTLRGELREAAGAPAQPPAFQLPEMGTPDQARAAWAGLEERLLESLVLLAAQTGTDQRWIAQVGQVQAAGGRVPRWPGWD